MDDLLQRARALYADRCQALTDVLARELPASFAVSQPAGGYFLWITGPDDFLAEQALAKCKELHNVVFQPGNWSSAAGQHRNCMRLSFAYNDKARLCLAAEKIAATIRQL